MDMASWADSDGPSKAGAAAAAPADDGPKANDLQLSVGDGGPRDGWTSDRQKILVCQCMMIRPIPGPEEELEAP